MLTLEQVRVVLDALEDAKLELEDPEVAELTTLGLDRKIERAIAILDKVLNHAED